MNENLKSLIEIDGYCVVKNIFDKDEVLDIKKCFDSIEEKNISKNQATINSRKSFAGFNRKTDQVLILGDLLAYKELRDHDFLIFNKKIIKIVKQILGESPQ